MIYVFMGPPASGKSTQSHFLAASLKLPVVSIGELAWEQAQANPDLKEDLQKGDLIPNKVILGILHEVQDKIKDNGIIDGIPRHEYQTECLVQLWDPKNIIAFHLSIPDEEVFERVKNRVTTSGERRADDTPQVVEHRLDLYKQAEPVIISELDAYGVHRIQINGNQTPELVHQEIMDKLKQNESAT